MLASPLKSPFEAFYMQQEEERKNAPSTLRKRRREEGEESGQLFAWNPTEQKRLRQDVDLIYRMELCGGVTCGQGGSQTNV